jgi:hypothetical protein
MPSAEWSAEETDDPGYADRRSFCKVERSGMCSGLRFVVRLGAISLKL